jgi:hypothetical protein
LDSIRFTMAQRSATERAKDEAAPEEGPP